jgi:hypothetical protein
MPAKRNDNRIASLAVAVASGQSVAAWCKANGVATRTGYGWAARPGLQRQVSDYRRRLVDRAIGLLAKHVGRAASEIGRLGREGGTEAIRLAHFSV